MTRRGLLGGAAAGTAALLAACTGGRATVERPSGTTGGPAAAGPPGADVVLVHGAWHNSSCWAQVALALAELGHRALALDLPGNGTSARFPAGYLEAGQPDLDLAPSPLAGVTLEDTAGAVLAAVRALREAGDGSRPLVLVGHSIGGIAITRAAEIAPELVDHLVYLTALCPTRLGTGAAYLTAPEQGPSAPGLYVGDPAVTGTFRINPRSTDPAYRELLRSVFYSDVSTEEFLAYGNALTPDVPLAVLGTEVGASAERWGSLPRTFVRTGQDRTLTPALQDLTIADADALTPDNPFDVVRLEGSSHSPFASRPKDVAEAIAGALP